MTETSLIQLVLTHKEAEILKCITTYGVGVLPRKAIDHIAGDTELHTAFDSLADKLNLIPSIINIPVETPPTV